MPICSIDFISNFSGVGLWRSEIDFKDLSNDIRLLSSARLLLTVFCCFFLQENLSTAKFHPGDTGAKFISDCLTYYPLLNVPLLLLLEFLSPDLECLLFALEDNSSSFFPN